MVENDESMDAPKNVLFHWEYNNYEKDAKSSNPSTLQNLSISSGNMKILKISRSNQKSGTPRMLIITVVFLTYVDDTNGRREMAQFENVNISRDV